MFGNSGFNRDAERIPLSVDERKNRRGEYDYYGASGVIDSINDYLFDKPLLLIGEDGANLINRSTPIAFIARGKYWVNNHAHVLDGISEDFLQYICLHINAISLEAYITGTAQPKMNQAKMNSIVLALPPLAEQKRIVAKVDELMALCDKLEEEQAENSATHQTLVETLLTTLTDVETPEAFFEAWQRIAEHFDTLFTTEQSIDKLQETILQLAVMGKLVPQDADDEPASMLLEKIAEEKEKLMKEGKLKKQKPFSVIDIKEFPFTLPDSWKWARLGNSGIGATGKTPSTKDTKNFNGDIPFLGPGQITPSGEILEAEKFLSEIGLEYSVEALEGDILMVCIGGSIGKSAIVNQRIAFNQQFNLIRPLFINSQYLKYTVSTDVFYKLLLEKATGSATPIINRGKWEELLIPIPPLNEQNRIVEKVDELMALCDRLRLSLRELQTTQINLADTVAKQLSE